MSLPHTRVISRNDSSGEGSHGSLASSHSQCLLTSAMQPPILTFASPSRCQWPLLATARQCRSTHPPAACEGTHHRSAQSAVPEAGAATTTLLARRLPIRSSDQPTTAVASPEERARRWSLLLNTSTWWGGGAGTGARAHGSSSSYQANTGKSSDVCICATKTHPTPTPTPHPPHLLPQLLHPAAQLRQPHPPPLHLRRRGVVGQPQGLQRHPHKLAAHRGRASTQKRGGPVKREGQGEHGGGPPRVASCVIEG